MRFREREILRLSRSIARGLVSDLVTGRPRAARGRALVSVLRAAAATKARPGGPRHRSPAMLAWDARRTFAVVPLSVEELADLQAEAAASGMGLGRWLRMRAGLPGKQS